MTAPRAARVGVAVLLFCQGTAVSSWVSRIPSIKGRLGLDTAELGLALLGPPVGLVLAVLTMPLLARRWSSAAIARWGMAIAAVATVLPAAAAGLPSLAVGLIALGMLLGLADIAMNIEAVAVERAHGRPLMSRLHAMYSLGLLAGSVAGSLAARLSVAPVHHLLLAGTVLGIIAIVVARDLAVPPSQATDRASTSAGTSGQASRLARHPGLVLTGLVAFCGYFAEGSVQDWSGVYLRETQGASLSTAALGTAACGIGMVAGRLVGDAVIGRYGRLTAVWRSALLASCGMFVAVLAPTPTVAIAAYAILGLGVAVIVPIMFTLAGNTQGARPAWAMGRFTMMGYSGLFAGPPVIGFVAHRVGLGVALSVPGVLLASIVPLAFALRRRQDQMGEPRIQPARACV